MRVCWCVTHAMAYPIMYQVANVRRIKSIICICDFISAGMHVRMHGFQGVLILLVHNMELVWSCIWPITICTEQATKITQLLHVV